MRLSQESWTPSERLSPDGIRTRVTGVRGQRPRPLDDRATFRKLYFRRDPPPLSNLLDGPDLEVKGRTAQRVRLSSDRFLPTVFWGVL